jgi:cobalt-zinc-cadmium efflux system outer membrane protein
MNAKAPLILVATPAAAPPRFHSRRDDPAQDSLARRASLRIAARLAAGFLLLASRSATAAAPALASPDDVARAVLEANPELAAIQERISALEHAVPQAGVWTDPRASVDYSNVPFSAPYPGGHPMAGVQFGLQQTFPFPGKTGARTAVAESRVATGRDELAERRVQLAGMVRDLYHQLALTRQLRVVTERHIALVSELAAAVRARYETGGAPQHDLLQLYVLRDRLTDDLDDFTRRDREISAALLATAHLPPDTPIATPEVTPLPSAPPSLAELVARAKDERPLLRQLADQAKTASLAAGRAEVEKRPDVTLSLGYRYRRQSGADPGDDFFSAGVSIPLPWFWNDRRWGELAQEERAKERSFESDRAARLDDIRGRLDAALARWRRADEKARIYERELFPEQQRTLESALASYRVGRAEFETLYRAELELLDFEPSARRGRTRRARTSRSRRSWARGQGSRARGEEIAAGVAG